jgi:hypothetical protein
MEIKPPKKVKRADCYCITTIEQPEKGKVKQSVLWFSTLEEAKFKYQELKEQNGNN